MDKMFYILNSFVLNMFNILNNYITLNMKIACQVLNCCIFCNSLPFQLFPF